jgi:hypothetical protein
MTNPSFQFSNPEFVDVFLFSRPGHVHQEEKGVSKRLTTGLRVKQFLQIGRGRVRVADCGLRVVGCGQLAPTNKA